MGGLCGGSHVPEECDLFIGLSPSDRLVVVAKKRLCYLCFRHADDQPCQLQSSLPACSIGGCMRMHSRLLHGALQKEETRAIVIEVEDDPEGPGEDEEFYAANFEILGREDEDEDEEMISEDGASSLMSSDGEHDKEPSPYEHLGEDRPRLCQQQVPLEVNGNLGFLHTLYDWETPEYPGEDRSGKRNGPTEHKDPQAGYQGLSRGGHHHGQRVLRAPHGRGWQRPGDPCVRSRGDSGRDPHKVTAPRKGDLPYHPARCTVDGNESRARGVAHRARPQTVVAHPRGGLVGSRR